MEATRRDFTRLRAEHDALKQRTKELSSQVQSMERHPEKANKDRRRLLDEVSCLTVFDCFVYIVSDLKRGQYFLDGGNML